MKNLKINPKLFSEYTINFLYNTSNFENKKPISPLRLQNILYLTYVYALLAWDKKLWTDNFEKGALGPLIPEVNDNYSKNDFKIVNAENYFFKIPELQNIEKLELEALMIDLNETYMILN